MFNSKVFLAEFVGTFALVFFGVNAGLFVKDDLIGLAAVYGLTMVAFVFAYGKISGAHLNPAVSVGLASAGKFDWNLVAPYIAFQMMGAIVGAVLVFLFYGPHYTATSDADAKLATFCTAPAIRSPLSNLFCEVVGTVVLVLAVLLSVDPSIDFGEVNLVVPATGKIGLGTLGALPVGLLVLSIGLSLGGTTGYAINPARDLGPRIAHALLPVPGKRDSDWGYAWIPVVGPLLGAVVATAIAAVLADVPLAS